jgi:iron(III) transport system permease protein
MSKTFAAAVYALTIAFFAAFFIWPIAQTLSGAFVNADGRITFAYLAEVFRNEIYLVGLRNAFCLGLASTGVTVAIALPLAFVTDRYDFSGKKALGALLLVPMILPPFVGAIGIRQILGNYGALNSVLTHLGLLGPNEVIDWLGTADFGELSP